jgi:hypothetical protein
MKIYYCFFLLLAFSSCEDYQITEPDSNKIYPTTLRKLSQFELDSLNVILNQKLDTIYRAEIDSFGLLCDYSGHIWPRGSDITDSIQAVSIVKAAIFNLNQFTNVSDTSDLVVKIGRKNNVTGDWDVIFINQFYKGMEVLNTQIKAILTNNCVVLYGSHHYKKIFIPLQGIIDKEIIKQKLIGVGIDYYCNSYTKYVITDVCISTETFEKCIFPLIKNDTIELHVCWKVPVFFDGGPLKGWHCYVDVLTGELLASEQTFLC